MLDPAANVSIGACYLGEMFEMYPDPALAISSAEELRAKSHEMGISVRQGMHSGRVEVADDDVAGLAVHIAARVMAAAGGGQVMVSRTIRDLMLGSGYRFDDLGPHALKGVNGTWELYSLAPVSG